MCVCVCAMCSKQTASAFRLATERKNKGSHVGLNISVVAHWRSRCWRRSKVTAGEGFNSLFLVFFSHLGPRRSCSARWFTYTMTDNGAAQSQQEAFSCD